VPNSTWKWHPNFARATRRSARLRRVGESSGADQPLEKSTPERPRAVVASAGSGSDEAKRSGRDRSLLQYQIRLLAVELKSLE